MRHLLTLVRLARGQRVHRGTREAFDMGWVACVKCEARHFGLTVQTGPIRVFANKVAKWCVCWNSSGLTKAGLNGLAESSLRLPLLFSNKQTGQTKHETENEKEGGGRGRKNDNKKSHDSPESARLQLDPERFRTPGGPSRLVAAEMRLALVFL